MAIRAMFTNHIYPENVPAMYSNGLYPYSSKKIRALSAGTNMRISMNSSGGIQLYAADNSYPSLGGWVYYTASELTDGVSPNSTIGFTAMINGALSGYESVWVVFAIGNTGFTYAELGLTSQYSPRNITAIIDRTVSPNVVTILLNGVFSQKKSLSVADSYSGASEIAFSASSGKQTASLQFSNFYFIDDTQDDTQCSYIPDLTLVNNTLTQVAEPTTWSGDGGTLISTSAGPIYSVFDLTARLFSSAAIPTKLNAKLNNVPIDVYGKVYGLDIVMTAARRDTSTVGKLTLELGSTISKQPDIKFIGTALTYEMRSPFNVRAPDGTRWNRDKLLNLVIGIEPTT